MNLYLSHLLTEGIRIIEKLFFLTNLKHHIRTQSLSMLS